MSFGMIYTVPLLKKHHKRNNYCFYCMCNSVLYNILRSGWLGFSYSFLPFLGIFLKYILILQCKARPYHDGFTCDQVVSSNFFSFWSYNFFLSVISVLLLISIRQQFKSYQEAAKCRFCEQELTAHNTASSRLGVSLIYSSVS